MIYLNNAFSLHMLPEGMLEFVGYDTSAGHVKSSITGQKVISGIGDKEILDIVNKELNVHLELNDIDIKLKDEDTLYVCQFVGGRLPAGATELPKDIKIRWFKVSVL